MAGEPEIAVKHAEMSLRLSPRIRMGGHFHVIGMAKFFMGNMEEAISKLLVAVQEHPGAPVAFRFLAAAYALSGQLEEAREVVARLRAISPVVFPYVSYLRKPRYRELLITGLHMAAGEEVVGPCDRAS